MRCAHVRHRNTLHSGGARARLLGRHEEFGLVPKKPLLQHHVDAAELLELTAQGPVLLCSFLPIRPRTLSVLEKRILLDGDRAAEALQLGHLYLVDVD